MKIKQSLPVDTTKLMNGLEPISASIVALKDYLRQHKDALYVTPQILDMDEPPLIIVLRIAQKGKETLLTMINPMLLSTRGVIGSEETQPGVEGVYLNFRHIQLQVAYNALPGCVPTEVTLTGKSALVFQQALRLTQGIAIDALGLRIDDYREYQEVDDEGKQLIFKNYVAALKEVQAEMLSDPDTAEYVKATDYVASKAQASITNELGEALQDSRDAIVAATRGIVEKEQASKPVVAS